MKLHKFLRAACGMLAVFNILLALGFLGGADAFVADISTNLMMCGVFALAAVVFRCLAKELDEWDGDISDRK